MSNTDEQSRFNQAKSKSEKIAEKLLTALNNGALCLVLSIGYRTGLFDVMSTLPPSTSEEIAPTAGLNERYVREWLGSMVTGRVVEIDPEAAKFRLPAEHAAFLTRWSGADNIAVFTLHISGLGGVEDDIAECFRK